MYTKHSATVPTERRASASKPKKARELQANLLAHKNITISYGQLNSVLLKYSVASKWASKILWGYHFSLLAVH